MLAGKCPEVPLFSPVFPALFFYYYTFFLKSRELSDKKRSSADGSDGRIAKDLLISQKKDSENRPTVPFLYGSLMVLPLDGAQCNTGNDVFAEREVDHEQR